MSELRRFAPRFQPRPQAAPAPAPLAPFPTTRELRAQGRVGTAALLERLSPQLREMAQWLVGTTPPEPMGITEGTAAFNQAIVALRLLNARREVAELQEVLAAEPDAPDAAGHRGRMLEVLRYVRDVERSTAVRPRDWDEVLRREAKPPPRAPRAAL